MNTSWFAATVPLLVGAAICGVAQAQESDGVRCENMLLGAVLLQDAAAVKSLLEQGEGGERRTMIRMAASLGCNRSNRGAGRPAC